MILDRSRIRLVVFDWAGTLVDCGSRAPALAFVETFARFGVEVTEAEARGPMGMPKRPHIEAMLAEPRVAEAWATRHGPADSKAVDRLYETFEPLAAEVAAREATPIPGVPEALAKLRARGIAIGSTTGYARAIMEGVLGVAAANGVAPDCVVCADDVANGRPAPDGVLANMAHFGVADPAETLKLDDAAPGIAEGVNAGAGAVGVTLTGNGAGLAAAELAALSESERSALRDAAAAPLAAAGAAATLDGVADLPDWLEG
ncbi:MAG: phosphonoacetaldehyde hydrolase [Pseudomonadota bacterium]